MKEMQCEQTEQMRKNYPQGTRLELISMQDPFSTLKEGDRCSVCGAELSDLALFFIFLTTALIGE
jgi:hypothetical protein